MNNQVKHEQLLYVGELPNLDLEARRQLVIRIEQLLLNQYHLCLSDSNLESLAIDFAGRLQARQSKLGLDLGLRGSVSSGHLLAIPQVEAIDLNSFQVLDVRQSGGEWLCHQIIERLGISTYLSSLGKWNEREISFMLLNLLGRLLHPVSERQTAVWVNESSSSRSLFGHTGKVYGRALRQSALDWWSVHEQIEDYLYDKLDSLLSFPTEQSYLYDLTNTYFEGRMLGSDLASYGRSKEKRSDAPLVSLGLLANESGFVRRSHYYAGNVSEPGTLADVLPYLEKEGGIVTDAGIGTVANIEQLAEKGISYMSVVRGGFSQYEVDFELGKCVTHHTANGYTYKVWLQTQEHDFKVNGKDYKDYLIFVKSEAKQRKEQAMLDRQKKGFIAGLETICKSLDKPRGHKSISQVHQRIGRLKAKYGRINRAFKLDLTDNGKQITKIVWKYDENIEKPNGSYIIRTSETVKDPQVAWKKYRSLTKVEAVNQCCKSDLNLRPVYHQKDEPIKAHLFLTVFACSIVQYIRELLTKAGIRHSWKEIVRIMETQKVVLSEFRNPNKDWIMLSKWSEPNQKVKDIYEALKIKDKPYQGFFFKIKNNKKVN